MVAAVSLHCLPKGFLHLVNLGRQIVARVSHCLRGGFYTVSLHLDFDRRLKWMRSFVPREFYCSVFQQLVSNYVA